MKEIRPRDHAIPVELVQAPGLATHRTQLLSCLEIVRAVTMGKIDRRAGIRLTKGSPLHHGRFMEAEVDWGTVRRGTIATGRVSCRTITLWKGEPRER